MRNLEVEIEKLDHYGRGITRVADKICFVENALPNEVVEIEIIKADNILNNFFILSSKTI